MSNGFIFNTLFKKENKKHFPKLTWQSVWHVICGRLLTHSRKDLWKLKASSRPRPKVALHRVLFTLVVIGTRPSSTALLPTGEPDSLCSFLCVMTMFHFWFISGVCLIFKVDFVSYLFLCFYLNLTSFCVWNRWIVSW